jgi:tripartite-type tricarboxylate transporter receptor subunit TctC
MKRSRFGIARLTAWFATLALCVVASAAWAAGNYPSRSIEWIVMWSAGGGADTATRTFTKYLEKELKQTIIVKNVVGGGGSAGYITARQARPDGYTLVTIQGDLAKFTPAKLAPIKIDEFDSIAGFAVQSPILIVRADSPWKTLADFVAAAKKKPGQLTVGVSDIGGVHHQPIVLWSEQAGINLRAVAHKGSPQMNAAILGGHVDAVSSYIRPALPYIKQGTLRPLAYFGAQRPKALPETPTFKELGFNIVWNQPYGMGGPAGLPADVKATLAKAAKAVNANPQFQKDLAKLGLEPYAVDGAEMRQDLLNSQAGIAKVIGILHGQK